MSADQEHRITDFFGQWTALPMEVLADKNLSGTAVKVYCAISSHICIAEHRHGAWPSRPRIAELCNVSLASVTRALKELEGDIGKGEDGAAIVGKQYIEVTHRNHKRGRKDRNDTNLYKILRLGKGKDGQESKCALGKAQNDTVKQSKSKQKNNDPADKPREKVGDFPTTEAPRELTIVPAEETLPFEPLKRERKPNPQYLAKGKEARRLWAQYIVSKSVGPPMANWSGPTLVKAGKTVLGLRDSPFADKTLEELMPLIVARMKTCEPFVRKSINFGWLFCADAPNLARLLAGDWDRDSGEVEVKVDERPLSELWPGE